MAAILYQPQCVKHRTRDDTYHQFSKHYRRFPLDTVILCQMCARVNNRCKLNISYIYQVHYIYSMNLNDRFEMGVA